MHDEFDARYDDLATRIIKRSIELYEPVVFVTINYRYLDLFFTSPSSGVPDVDILDFLVGLINAGTRINFLKPTIRSLWFPRV